MEKGEEERGGSKPDVVFFLVAEYSLFPNCFF